MNRLLISEPPLQVLPSLAALLGLQRAVFLQQLHYWLEKPSAHERDGRRWVYNTYEKWHEQLPFFSVRTLKRIVAELVESGLILTKNFNTDKRDRTLWYTINYNALDALLDEGFCKVRYGTMESDNSSPSTWGQDDTTHSDSLALSARNMEARARFTETTSETSTESKREKRAREELRNSDAEAEEARAIMSLLEDQTTERYEASHPGHLDTLTYVEGPDGEPHLLRPEDEQPSDHEEDERAQDTGSLSHIAQFVSTEDRVAWNTQEPGDHGDIFAPTYNRKPFASIPVRIPSVSNPSADEDACRDTGSLSHIAQFVSTEDRVVWNPQEPGDHEEERCYACNEPKGSGHVAGCIGKREELAAMAQSRPGEQTLCDYPDPNGFQCPHEQAVVLALQDILGRALPGSHRHLHAFVHRHGVAEALDVARHFIKEEPQRSKWTLGMIYAPDQAEARLAATQVQAVSQGGGGEIPMPAWWRKWADEEKAAMDEGREA